MDKVDLASFAVGAMALCFGMATAIGPGGFSIGVGIIIIAFQLIEAIRETRA